jgi:hypothetical protein
MTDYTVDRLSIERIEGFARDVLANCPKLPNSAIDILATLRLPTVMTIHGRKVLRLKLVADDGLLMAQSRVPRRLGVALIGHDGSQQDDAVPGLICAKLRNIRGARDDRNSQTCGDPGGRRRRLPGPTSWIFGSNWLSHRAVEIAFKLLRR